MIQCPHCSHSFEADFGMISCPQCKQMVFVDFDGNVQQPDDSAPEQEPFETDTSVEMESAPELEEATNESAAETEDAAEFYADGAQEEFERTEDASDAGETVMQEDVDFSPETTISSTEGDFVEEIVEEISDSPIQPEFEKPPEEIEEEVEEAAGSYAPEDLQELADYGNSELSVAKDGQFLYDLRVSGIDSQEIKKLIEENLTDKRLGLNVKGLMKSIKGGVLEIRRINAIKTSILVNRFKSLPVTLNWRQNVITQMDINH